MTTASTHLAALTGAMLVLAACDTEIDFADDTDTTFDFRATDSDEGLHGPYVVGAQLQLRARGTGLGAGLTLRSSDAEVLELGDTAPIDGELVTGAIARGRGHAELWVVDGDGDIVAATDVEVRAPSRAVLHAAAPLFVDRDDVPTEAVAPRVLLGGEATFMVQYFDGSTRLWGHGELALGGEGGLDVVAAPTHLGESRSWIHVVAHEPGMHALTLATGGEVFAQLDVEVVGAEAISEIELYGHTPQDAAAVVIAAAYDLDGAPVWGVDFDWQRDAVALQQAGDILRVGPGDDGDAHLAVAFGALEDELVLDGPAPRGAEGCGVGQRAGAGAPLVLLLLLAAALTSRSSPCGTRWAPGAR